MTDSQKNLVAGGAIVGAFILGWWLHKPKPPVSGNVVLHFIPSSVQYDALPTVPSTYEAVDATFEPGEYTVNMRSIGG